MNKLIKGAWSLTVLVVMMMLSASLTSCKDDKDDDKISTESLVGVWRSDFSCGYQLMTLEKNGRYSFVEIDYESENWSATGTYAVKNNVITIQSEGEIEVYTILTLTSTKLILRYEGEYIGQYADDYDEYIEEWTRVE